MIEIAEYRLKLKTEFYKAIKICFIPDGIGSFFIPLTFFESVLAIKYTGYLKLKIKGAPLPSRKIGFLCPMERI